MEECYRIVKRLHNANAPMCVFGIMDNERGRAIANEMLEWLLPVYDVHCVYHDGSLFEYPAIAYMQQLTRETGKPCLYLHTRGAVNVWKTTVPTRKMWKEEFGVQWRKYFAVVDADKPRVACPFVDYDGETRYNGFVANASAMAMLDLHPETDRMQFERLWVKHDDCEVIGMLINSQRYDIAKIRNYLYRNYEGL